jgi:hypothetical protein
MYTPLVKVELPYQLFMECCTGTFNLPLYNNLLPQHFLNCLEYIHVLGGTQNLSIAICQEVVSKDLMSCKSGPWTSNCLG